MMSRIVNIFVLSLCIALFSATTNVHAQDIESLISAIEQNKQNDQNVQIPSQLDLLREQQEAERKSFEEKEAKKQAARDYIAKIRETGLNNLSEEEIAAGNKALQDYEFQKAMDESVAARDATYVAPQYAFKGAPDPCSGTNKCQPSCYYKQIEKCTFCGLLEVAFNTASKMTLQSINTFSGSVIKVVIIAFAIWLAITILNFTATLEVRDFKDLAQSVIKQAFLVMIAVLILQGGVSSFMNLILNPVFQTGMNIAEATVSPQEVGVPSQNGKNEAFTCPETNIYNDATGEGALPKAMGDSIICTMTLIQQRAARVKALGSAAMCYSWEKKAFIIPHLGYFLTGLGLWVGAMVMIIAVPFLMVDAVIQLAVAGALLPMAIGAFAFKSTQKYTKKVWETFLNSMFAFLFMSLIVLMLATAFENILVQSTGSLDDLLAGTGGDIADILKELAWFSKAFLEVCFVLILMWTVMAEARDFAGNFSGSISNTSIGSQIATMGGSMAKGMALKSTKPLREAAGEAASKGVVNLARGAAGLGRQAVMNYQTNRARQRGTKVGNTYTYTSRNGRKTFVLTENADGSTTLAKNTVKTNRAWIPGKVQADGKRHWGFGTKVGTVTQSKIKNDTFSTTSKTYLDKDGKVIGTRDSTVRNSLKGSSAFDRQGRYKDKAMSMLDIPQGVEGRDKMAVAAVKDLIGQRMPNMNINAKMYTQQKAIYDGNGRCIGYEEINADGSKTIAKLSFDANNRLTTEFTTIDARGRGTALSSNGIINTKASFRTEDGKRDGKIDENSVKTSYGVSSEYQRYYQEGRFRDMPWDELKGIVGEEKALEIQKYLRGHHEFKDANMYEFRTKDQF